MTEPIELNFTMTADILHKGIQAGSKRLAATLPRRTHIRTALWFTVIAVCGAVAVVFAQIAAGIPYSITGVLIGASMAFAAAAVLQGISLRHVAHTIVATGNFDGLTETSIDETGISERSGLGDIFLPWRSFSEVIDFKHGVVVRFGALLVTLPDMALPEGMDRDQLKDRVLAFAQ